MTDKKKPPNYLYWSDPDSGELVVVIFDAITTMTPEDTVDITEHPVEEGANVTDHARSNAGRLTIEGIVSLSPNLAADAFAAELKGVSVDPNAAGLTASDFSADARSSPGHVTITLDIPSPPIQLSESGLLQGGIGALKKSLLGAPKARVLAPTQPISRAFQAWTIRQDPSRNKIRDVYDTLLKVKESHTLITAITAHRDHFNMMIERIAAPRTAEDGASAKFQIDLKQIRTVSSQQVQAPKPSEPRAQPPGDDGSKSGKEVDPKDKSSLLAQAYKFFNIAVTKSGLSP